jgi:hypothetical protein
MKRLLIAVLLLLGSLGAAFAQAPSATYCYVANTTPPNNWQPCSATNPLQISGSISASLGGFTPSTSGARGTPFTVTTSDSSGTLPTGTVVIVSNPGANPMYCNVNGVAATTSDQPVAAGVGNWFAFTIPAGITTLHCIATGGSTTANMLGGSGLATGSGGGGGGAATTVTANNGTATTTGAKVTISVTNTYQQALASSGTRKGCTIQYIAVAGIKGYVFFGSAPGDTTTSFQLTNGQSINCQTPGVTLTDAVQVTATATDIFVVSNQ